MRQPNAPDHAAGRVISDAIDEVIQNAVQKGNIRKEAMQNNLYGCDTTSADDHGARDNRSEFHSTLGLNRPPCLPGRQVAPLGRFSI